MEGEIEKDSEVSATYKDLHATRPVIHKVRQGRDCRTLYKLEGHLRIFSVLLRTAKRDLNSPLQMINIF
jgi:hypothetical protein